MQITHINTTTCDKYLYLKPSSGGLYGITCDELPRSLLSSLSAAPWSLYLAYDFSLLGIGPAGGGVGDRKISGLESIFYT